jgi:NADH-quinone oxidoreductase subunit L
MTSFLLAAEEVGPLSDGGVLAEWAGIMLVSPFIAFLLIIWLGKRMKYEGGEFAVAAMAVNLVIATGLFFQNMRQGILHEVHFEIAKIGLFQGRELVFQLGWIVDGLSIMMYWVVAFVGLLVFLYAIGYMHGEARVTMFFASFSLFAGSMLILVGSPNLIQLIIGWEGVGLASYLLIGHYWEGLDNVRAGNKAFLTNKVADVGLVLGAIFLGMGIGDFGFQAINTAAEAGDEGLSAVAVAGALLMFLGAMGKSAQFPLHIWLPDAMAGPTPVSALMHAATMVTAGIYLMARIFPVYEYMAGAEAILGDLTVRGLMVIIGTITLFAMGLLALVANDLKKVLAYSTVSQLGYMMTAVAAGGYTAGLFHLFTHAFFKALLFLGAGSVIHAVHSNNMTDMGGLRKDMPHTYRTFMIGSLALAGIIPLAGFWSKDEILATLDYEGYRLVFWIAVAGAFITAFYMTRAIALTFFGTYKGHGHPHESPTIMTGPLWALAVPSLVAGFLNVPGLKLGSFNNFTSWVAAREVLMGDHHPEAPDWGLAAIGLGAAVLGIVAGWLLFSRDAETQEARDRLEIPVLYPVLRAKYYMDHAAWGLVGFTMGPAARAMNWVNTYIIDGIINGIAAAVMALGRFVYGGLDQRGIDGFYNGIAMASDAAGTGMRRLQTGRVQQYATGFVVGALVLVVTVAIFR